MLMKLATLFGLAAFSSAANLRSGPKDLAVDLGGLQAHTEPSSRVHRMLAMHGLVRDLADFEWDLDALEGFPTIAFEGAGSESEVRFKYNYTGTTVENVKYLEYSLREGDCVTEASNLALNAPNGGVDSQDGFYTVDVDILQETVTNTPLYMDIDEATAMINFCIRVDYIYEDGTPESINFHETNVTITIDLTANFTLTAVNVDRIDADQVDEDVALNCKVQAYFCDGDSTEVDPQPTLVQGSIMQICVEIHEDDVALYHLSDVVEMDVSQVKADSTTDSSSIVADQAAVGLSDKMCKNGICNIRHQLSSKFFDERNPNDLDISGIAICAFGPLGDFTKRVGRAFSSAFTTANTKNDLTSTTLASCMSSCKTDVNCLSFSAPKNADGTISCTLVEAYPEDSDLIDDATSVVYLENDVA